MKILLLNTLYTPNLIGGAERVVQSLAQGIVETGYHSVVVCAAPTKSTRVDWVNGVKVYYIGLKNLYWPWGNNRVHFGLKPAFHVLDTYHPWMAREVARILDIERPDLVHTNNIFGFSTLTWRRVKQRGLPIVHTLHDYYLLCPQGSMFRGGENCETRCIECRLYSLPRKSPSNQVDSVVGVSEAILERHLKRGYFATTSRTKVIHNAYRLETSMLQTDSRRSPVRFGYLGKLSAEKGLEVLLKSLTQLPAGKYTLEVAGRGHNDYESYLQGKYRMLPIRFLGYTRPEFFFPKLHVLVVPSLWHDPLPTVIIEAYAHGVPVIGSNRGGIPQLVEEGRTGFLFDPYLPGDLRAKMQRFIDKPTLINDMRSACLSKAEHFLPENIVEQYLGVYAYAIGNDI